LISKLKIDRCPDCGGEEIQVHTDRFFIVNTTKKKAYEPEKEANSEDVDVTEIVCRKCGSRITALQDIIIFKTAIMEQLKGRLNHQPTNTEFLNYIEILETDLPSWLQSRTLDVSIKPMQQFS
jgi:DNA-directed RNA polymerase subunit RPC12/RpoP